MNNFEDITELLEETKQAFERAKKLFAEKDYRWTCHCSQVSIELAAKSVISCFTEFDWTHDPSEQLKKIIEMYKEKIINCCGEQMINDLQTICEDAKISAPWHGISIYGMEDNISGCRISSLRACTEEIAKDLLSRAERTYKIAEKFINIWFGR